MKIAVLSGKGGTGKTFIASNLADVLSRYFTTQLLDCDVEEPNSHLFFKINNEREEPVHLMLPKVDQDACTHCGLCAKACQFGAIASYPNVTMVFENLCHGCGVCSMVCPENAISEEAKIMGVVTYGSVNEDLGIGMGILNIGEPSGVRVIRQLKKNAPGNESITILDAPPGSSCPVVETLRGVDYAVLITEATPFGLHDIRSVIHIIRDMNIPFGVIVNRDTGGFQELDEYLKKEQITVLGRISWKEEIARVVSQGKLYNRTDEEFEQLLKDIFETIQEAVV